MDCFDDAEWRKRHGVIPVLSSDKKTITYGLYPQTVVIDPNTIIALNSLTTPESNGWYLYENEYYAKLKAKPFESYYVFNNGIKIMKGGTYWFKCEPIKWIVLSNNNGEYFILSSVLLDAHCYDASDSNNYKDSDIRAWLNNEFYNSAFSLNNTYINATVVDNSAATTDRLFNPFACGNTKDKVFLLSYQDYTFTSGKLRERKTTDYARANGICYNSDDFGNYWTRSPMSFCYSGAWPISQNGLVRFGFRVSLTWLGVRPCLNIKSINLS